MPITDIVVVCVIVSAFAIFALALAWGDYQTREIAEASRQRTASSVNVVPFMQNAPPENSVRIARGKTSVSADQSLLKSG
jgi:hypothetical protein